MHVLMIAKKLISYSELNTGVWPHAPSILPCPKTARGWSDHFRGGRGLIGAAVAAEILSYQHN